MLELGSKERIERNLLNLSVSVQCTCVCVCVMLMRVYVHGTWMQCVHMYRFLHTPAEGFFHIEEIRREHGSFEGKNVKMAV